MSNKIPISGGPHTGKTTLIGALQERFPDAYFVDEPATRVIDRELEFAALHEDYEPQVPWLNYPAFAPKVIAESEKLEYDIPYGLTFLDRSVIENSAYGRINGFEDLIPELEDKIWLANYDFALLCQPLGEYMLTGVRRETAEEALLTHAAIEEAYKKSDLEVVTLPPLSISDRVDLVEVALQSRGII